MGLAHIFNTIKYGKRTWVLWFGVLKTLSRSHVPRKYLQKTFSREFHIPRSLGGEHDLGQELFMVNKLREELAGRDEASVLRFALVCIDSAVNLLWDDDSNFPPLWGLWDGQQHGHQLLPKVLKILEIELSLVYDYIYTKAMVLQTEGGIILRCISLSSFVASFLLFATTVASSEHYSSIDTATTYVLFVGGLSLEACALFTTVSSAWAWAWLEARRHCSFLASIIVGWQRKRVLWSHSMGQYNLQDYLAKDDQRKSKPWKGRVISRIRKMVDKTCGQVLGLKRGHELQFWISKHLDIKFVKVDEGIMQCIFEVVAQHEEAKVARTRNAGLPLPPQHLPNLGAVLAKLLSIDDPESRRH
ncbi:hypothetical protein U9M48_026961 [Paspalum notatum var. saurae]|uniref:DUF4220 domain-containing protein n=1 Tax=Paspalum notatum var. saurae TaxID=547442 RepID=A0AAQ3TTR2_PASNO